MGIYSSMLKKGWVTLKHSECWAWVWVYLCLCGCVSVCQSHCFLLYMHAVQLTLNHSVYSDQHSIWWFMAKLKLWNCSAQEYCFSSKYKCFRYTHVHAQTHARTHTPVLKVIIFSFVSVMTSHSNLSLHTWADSGVGLVSYWPHWEHNANGETKLDQGKQLKASSS